MKYPLSIPFLSLLPVVFLSENVSAQFVEDRVFIGANYSWRNIITERGPWQSTEYSNGYGVEFEYAIGEKMGLGLMIRFYRETSVNEYSPYVDWMPSEKKIVLTQIVCSYHLIPYNEFDPFLGIRFGIADMHDAYVGFRWFTSKRFALHASYEYGVAGELDQRFSTLVFGVHYGL